MKYSVLKLSFFSVVFAFSVNSALAQTSSDIVYTCRYFGEDFNIGETICLSTSIGLREAACGMVLNNSAWKISGTECASATEKKARTNSKAQQYIDKYIRDYNSSGISK